MITFSNTQLASLTAIFNTIIPKINNKKNIETYWQTDASDFGVAQKALELIGQLKIEEKKDFQTALKLIDSPLLGITWFGALKPARNLTPNQIEMMLKFWSNSPLNDLRKLFTTFKKLSAIIYYGDSAHTEYGKAIGYELPRDENFRKAQHISPLIISKDTTLSCDVVVVGSGAGGSIVAANLAAKGKKVIVLDKGQYFKNEDNTQREQEMIAKTFEAQGLMTSKDGGMSILAGSNVGGGTSINWAGCLRTPDWILEEWAKDYNNPQFLDPEYLKGFDAIELRNSINANLPHNPQNKMLWQAGEQSNFTPSYIPQNFKKEPSLDADIQTKAMGFSCIGDYYGLKQSATQTFLADACANGADIIANTHIENIIIKNNKAVGVKGKSGHFNIEIKAEKVVIASGALHTPTILLRSGLQHQEIGRNLYLHPVSPVPALYDARIEPWHGAMMTTVIKDFERLDGNYGFKLECPPVHPGLAGTVLNWVNGEDFKSKMLELPNLGIFFPLVRDKKGGQVRLSPKSKLPEIQYVISDYDKKHLVRGVQECVKLHLTAGAKRINIIHNDNLEFFPDKENLQDFLKRIENAKWRSNSFGLFSAHQMGTCRMGGNADSPVKPNGETREVQNLFIADTSLFPSASGVNPMLSAQALAWYVSQQI